MLGKEESPEVGSETYKQGYSIVSGGRSNFGKLEILGQPIYIFRI